MLSAYLCVGCLLQQNLSSAYESEHAQKTKATSAKSRAVSVYSAMVGYSWESTIPIVHTCRPEPAQVIGLSQPSTSRLFVPAQAFDLSSAYLSTSQSLSDPVAKSIVIVCLRSVFACLIYFFLNFF